MLFNTPLLLVVFAVIIALKYRGKWYRASLLFSGLSIALIIYVRTIHTVRVPDAQCFSDIQACAHGEAASTANIIRLFLLAFLFSIIALLLSYKKSAARPKRGAKPDASRKVLISISLLALIGSFLFITFLFYALSQI